MDSVLRVKDGVQFAKIDTGGLRIIAELVHVAQALDTDIWITSGTEGVHSGPEDPHPQGRAYDADVEPHDTAKLQEIVQTLMGCLGIIVTAQDGGWVTEKFFGWIEAAGTPNEHAHIQVRHGVIYP